MISPKSKRTFLKIIPYGIFWFVFSTLYTVLEKSILGNLNYYPTTGNPYDFYGNLLVTPLFSLVMGLGIGAVEVVYLNKRFIRQSFTVKIWVKTTIYLSVIICFLIITSIFANAVELHSSVLNAAVLENSWQFMFSYSSAGVILYMGVIIVLSLFYNEVTDSLGSMMIKNFFTGKYYRPIQEERIFLFLDMKGSTSIAEKLGHVTYFTMLKEYFADLSPAIVQFEGEIYQYVGDEIVITWRVSDQHLNSNSLRCFFEMKAALHRQSTKYLAQYGTVPTFKAGLHLGSVTTGEIGVIKKELIFTGDVLNTTARIMELCNMYEVDLLLSGQLVDKLADVHVDYRSLGEISLRGKDEKIKLYTLSSDQLSTKHIPGSNPHIS